MKNDFSVSAITSGEPAGIGLDICIDLFLKEKAILPFPLVILADIDELKRRSDLLKKKINLIEYDKNNIVPISVKHIPVRQRVQAGKLDCQNAPYVLDLLDNAIAGVLDGSFSTIITAPIHKGIINESGEIFTGHTEYFSKKAQVKQVVMMLSGGGLNVALATTHLPLSLVPSSITQELIVSVVKIIYQDFKKYFGKESPRIAVTGLNPHAGENGHLGKEEIDIIIPAIKFLQQEGIIVVGPLPADTVFQPFIVKEYDIILAMYHDQGLPALKYASFSKGVNITLGLPFIRTSVDHGTALELAGTGRAESSSLFTAIEVAHNMHNSFINQKYG